MTVGFPKRRAPKPEPALPCTTRTFEVPADQIWDQATATLHTELGDEVIADAASIAEAERAGMRMLDGLRLCPHSVSLSCLGSVRVSGRVTSAGRELLLVEESATQLTGVRPAAVVRIEGLTHRLAAVTASVELTWGAWVRELCTVRIGEVQLVAIDGWSTTGVIGFAGADFLRMTTQGARTVDVAVRSIAVLRTRSTRPIG